MAKGRTNKQGGASVSLTGDAVVAEVLNSKTFYNTDPNTKLTGTMPNKVGSATVITPSTSDQTIPQGYYGGAAGDGKVIGDDNLVAGNIKNGVNLFGIAGTFTGTGSIISTNRVGVPNDTTNSFMPYITLVQIKPSVTPISLASSANLQYLYLLNSSGILYRSADAGKTWANATHTSYVYVICSSSGQYVYLFQNGGNIKYSSDYGANFTTKSDRVYGIGDCSADGSIVYADVDTLIYKSTDYGANFTSTGVQCRNGWSNAFQHIVCSDDGLSVYYSKITTMYMWKSTDGLATAGSVVYSTAIGNSKYCSSQDGSKWAHQNKLSNAVALANSYLCGGIFNNGSYIAYSAGGIRSGAYANASYWSDLGNILTTSSGSDMNPRIKGTDAFLNWKGNVIFAIGC